MESIRITKRSANTIEKIAAIALEHIPMTFSPSDIPPGRKVYFPIPTKKDPQGEMDFIYIYAESKLQGPPKNLDIGFTTDDIIDSTGVYIFSQKKGSKLVVGEVYPLDVFLRDVISDLSLRNRIIYRVGEMRDCVHLDEQFIEIVNGELRANKENAKIFGVKRLH